MHSNRLSTVVCATIPLLARQLNIYMPHDILPKVCALVYRGACRRLWTTSIWTIAPSGQPTGPLSFCQEPLSASLARVGCHPALAQCSHGQESRFLCTRHWCGPTPTPTVAQLEEFSRIPPLRSYSVVRLYGCYCAVCTTVFCVGNSVSGGAGGQCVLKMRRWVLVERVECGWLYWPTRTHQQYYFCEYSKIIAEKIFAPFANLPFPSAHVLNNNAS